MIASESACIAETPDRVRYVTIDGSAHVPSGLSCCTSGRVCRGTADNEQQCAMSRKHGYACQYCERGGGEKEKTRERWGGGGVGSIGVAGTSTRSAGAFVTMQASIAT